MPSSPWVWGCFVVLGGVLGAAGTVVGVGGAFLLMPVLLFLYPHESPATITSITLAVVCANSVSGTIAYARLRRIEYRTALLLSAAALPGAVLGALVTYLIPRAAFDRIFGVAMLALALRLGTARTFDAAGSRRPHAHAMAIALVLSAGVGFLSSVLGIGGGIIHVPLLIEVLGFAPHAATATSHCILAIMSSAGTLTHILSGEFTHGIHRAIALSLGAVVGAQWGARVSHRLHSRWILRGLAAALLLVGLRLVLTTLGA